MTKLLDIIQHIKAFILKKKEEIEANNPDLIYPTKPTSTKDAMKSTYRTPHHIPAFILSEECKEVVIWFEEKAVATYQICIMEFLRYLEDDGSIRGCMDDIERYTYAWSDNKIIAAEAVHGMQRQVQKAMDTVEKQFQKATRCAEAFYQANADDVLVDSRVMKLYEYTDRVDYGRIHGYFFKRLKIHQDKPNQLIRADIVILDKILVLLDILYAGWGKVGYDEDFTGLYRRRQQDLLTLIHQYVNGIEQDIHTLEVYKKLAWTPLNLKLYPKR